MHKAPQLDTLILPIGGGGLMSGMAIAAKAIKPEIEIFGVQTVLYPSMYNALRGETGTSGGATVAEGIAVQTAAARTMAIIGALVSDVLLVDEAEIEHAIALLLEVEKTVAEGAGATGLAALLRNRDRFTGRKVGLVITAGNIDSRLLASVILRELSRAGRISIFHVELTDRPSSLAKIASVIGDAGGNIIEVPAITGCPRPYPPKTLPSISRWKLATRSIATWSASRSARPVFYTGLSRLKTASAEHLLIFRAAASIV